MKIQRKSICAAAAAVIFIGIAGLAWNVLRGYAGSVPVVVGPYKQAAFILLGTAFCLAVGFSLRPFSKRTVVGSLLLALGVLWFTARMILGYRSPDSALVTALDRWMPFGLAMLGAGIALWIGALFPKLAELLPKGKKVRLALLLLLMFLVLQPVLRGGFYWDDAFYSVNIQVMRLRGESLFARVWEEIAWYAEAGRLRPFASFVIPVFYFFPNAFVYKLFLLILTLTGGVLFFRFLREWQGDERLALGGTAAVCLCFQLRLYHDALNSYFGYMQVLFIELILALHFFVKFLRNSRTAPLLGSLLFFVMGLMSYEMFFPLTALFLLSLIHI